ncbi:MAG: chemotaxis protein CheW [Succinivibrio sp.]|nr:chemotaxis protein CheW [Succinivibrio sp.]
MGLSHFEREEETLVNYFKQMLNESYDLDDDIAPREFLAKEEDATRADAAGKASESEYVAEGVDASEPMESSAPPVTESEAQNVPVAAESEQSNAGDNESSLHTLDASSAEEQHTGNNADETDSSPSADMETQFPAETGDKSDQVAESVGNGNFAEDGLAQADESVPDSFSESGELAAKDDVYQSGISVMEPVLQKQEESEHRTESLPFAEQQSIASLLESVPSEQTGIETAVETEREEVTEVVAEVVEPTTHPVVQINTQAPVVVDAETTVPGDEHLEWENINMPDEFQALFFLARGVRFAVPLVDLGGIFEVNHLTPLFGRPAWYKGVADIRGKKLNVVDTLRWVKPEVTEDSDFNYIIVLGESLWAISCDKLEGNRYLKKENVKWRQHAGNRPWLAGIVKKEMCALLHVNALISMFNKGFDLTDLK